MRYFLKFTVNPHNSILIKSFFSNRAMYVTLIPFYTNIIKNIFCELFWTSFGIFRFIGCHAGGLLSQQSEEFIRTIRLTELLNYQSIGSQIRYFALLGLISLLYILQAPLAK